MSIIDRIKLNIRANVNYALDRAEDPQKILNQFIIDLEESIKAFKEALVCAIADTKKMELEIKAASEKVSLWADRAMLAMKKGDEDLAKQALLKKIAYMEKEQRLNEDLQKQKQTVNELKESLPELEKKLESLRRMKSQLAKNIAISKIEATKSSVPSRLYIDSEVFDIYDSMVDRVKATELYAEALEELSKTDEIESKFKEMEINSAIESELKKLKENMTQV